MYYSKNDYPYHLACPRLRLCCSVARLNTECAAILRAKEFCAAWDGGFEHQCCLPVVCIVVKLLTVEMTRIWQEEFVA